VLLASAVDTIGSSGFLGFVLGGGLLTAVLGGYRFIVNYRITERGIARDRVDQAVRDERKERTARQRAEREAILWQSRCGDLEYALRQVGAPVPPISAELHVLAFSSNSDTVVVPAEGPPSHRPRRRNNGDDALTGLESRLRRQELDESGVMSEPDQD
jgi:hypothetical protein